MTAEEIKQRLEEIRNMHTDYNTPPEVFTRKVEELDEELQRNGLTLRYINANYGIFLNKK